MLLSKFRGSDVEIKDDIEREIIGAKPENCWPHVSPMKKRAAKIIQTPPWKPMFGHRAMSHASFKECEWTQHAPTNFLMHILYLLKD
jgi:hypothetical protein